MTVATFSDHPFPISGGSGAPKRLSTTFIVALSLSVAVHGGVGAYLAYKKFVMPAERVDPGRIDGGLFEIPPPPPKKPVVEPEPQLKTKSAVRFHDPVAPPAEMDVDPLIADPKPIVLAEGLREPPINLDGEVVTPPQPKPAMIGRPDWLRKPTPAQMSNAFPDRALRGNISGTATLSCKVTAIGAVRDCTVLSETPSEYGFGTAALKVTKHFKMRPQTVDGQAVDGASVRIPMSFKLED